MSRCLPAATRLLGLAALVALASTGSQAQTRILLEARPAYVEFRALGSDGSPVPDLTASEVVLRVDGKPRVVTALDFVRLESGRAERARPEPFATNDQLAEERDILLVLEDDAMAPGTEKPVRSLVDELLRRLAPADRVGILNIPTGRANVGLTTDRDIIRSSLTELVGLSTRGQTDSDARCRTLLTLEAMRNLILSVRGGPSTTLVFFSAGLTLPETVAPLRLGQPTETCIVRTNHYNDFKEAATLAGVNFYSVHVFDDAASAQPALTNDLVAGLELLTGAANGDMIRLTSDVSENVARAVRETTAFYRATFDPDPSERDDKSHRLELSVARAGVAVRFKPAIVLERAAAQPAPAKTLSVADLLRVGDVRRDLPLRAAAYPSRGDTKNTVKLVVVFQAADTSEPIASAAVALYDERSRLTSQVTVRKEELARSPAYTALSVKPGTYRLRVAAADRSGRVGTLDTQVQARLIDAPPITMSALILGTRSSGTFTPRLIFGADPALVTYLEVYGVPKATEISAAIELAETPEGPALGTVAANVLPGNDEGTWQVQAGIALTQVPPGDYVLRALVVVEGKLAGKAMRTLRKMQSGGLQTVDSRQ